jgi:hypothetical protein
MDYFPQSLASGKSFCNRVREQAELLENIQASRATLIASPRRYGKTSLAMQCIAKSKLPYAHFDFLSAVSTHDVERIIMSGVGKLLSRIEKGPRKVLKLATDFFAGLSIKLSSDALGLSVDIQRKEQDPAANILSVLERVDKLAEKYKVKIVLLFDEFQRVYEVSDDYAIESVIRQVAQSSHNLSFIFSGSNRHLLDLMFSDKNRPFYKLCDRMALARISCKDYKKYICSVAKKTGHTIDQDAIEMMFKLTERHPYYMNMLCHRVWRHEHIKIEGVQRAWADYAFEERSQVASDLDSLSLRQRKLLAALAREGGVISPRSSDFQKKSGIASTTIKQALEYLLRNDYVYKPHDQAYQVLDPLIRYILVNG